jgi:hypothetical protein
MERRVNSKTYYKTKPIGGEVKKDDFSYPQKLPHLAKKINS